MNNRFLLLSCIFASSPLFSTAASIDIGDPWPAGGSAEISPGNWMINGSGHDIWGQSDSFHFYNFESSSDVTVTALVDNWDTNHGWAKGGLMIRESLDANAAHTMIASTGDAFVQHMYRGYTGDYTRSSYTNVGTKRVWLRLVKEGDKITSYYKLESQTNYEKFYERAVTFAGSSFFVGIAVTSHVQGQLASLTVRNFEILNRIWVPIPPRNLDIGKPATAGDAMETSPGNWTIMGAGNDIWGHNDQFHFVQFNRTTDVTLTCFVESWATSYAWAKGGIMIRDTLDPNSANAMIASVGDERGRVHMQARPDSVSYTQGTSEVLYTDTKRMWLRLVKKGSKITGYYKNEFDLVYQKLASYEVEFTRNWYYVGIAVTSHIAEVLSTLEVSHFSMSDELFTLPATDVGDTGRDINAQKLDADTWSIEGAGWDIGGTADSFAFNNYKQSGENLTATVHLDVLKQYNLNSKGGIMLRASLSPESPHVSLLTAKTGLTMFYRQTEGGGTTSKNVGVWSQHMELKLEKIGNTIACLYKHKSHPDWFYLDSVPIEVGSDYFVGHAVTSAQYGREATLVAGNIYVNDEAIIL